MRRDQNPRTRALYINNSDSSERRPPREAEPGPAGRLMNVRQLSAYLALPVATLYTWVSLRRIPDDCIVHLGRTLRFDREAVDRWVSASCAEAIHPASGASGP